MMKKFWCCLCFVFIAATAAAAEKKVSAQGEFAYLKSGGNSEVTNLSAKNKLQYVFSERVTGLWKISALNSVSDQQRNVESYASELRADYSWGTKSYSGVFGGWKKDRFANLDDQYYAGAVYGYKFLVGPRHFFKSETGLDYVTETYYDDSGTPLIDESTFDRDYLRGRIFAEYEFQFSAKTKFSQSLEYLHDFSESTNYNINSVTVLSTVLTDIFSLKTSYEIKYDNQPASETTDDTDSLLLVALVYDY